MTEMVSSLERILELAHGYWASSCLLAANKLGIFNVLEAGPRDAHQISKEIGGDLRATTILLNALVALSLLEKEGNLYKNRNLTSRYLVTGRPEAITNLLLHSYDLWEAWGNLAQVVKKGRPATDWEESFLRRDPQRVAHFIKAMDEIGGPSAAELARRLDLTRVRRMLDAGGGPGTYAFALIRANPAIKATIFDLPLTLEVAREFVKKNHLEDQVELREGDLTKDPLGEGYDLVLFSQVLHAYPPEENKRFLKKGYEALNPGGQLIIHEYALEDDKCQPVQAAIFSVNMLVNTPAGEAYSLNELKGWMLETGLREIRIEDILGRSKALIGYK